jgi:DNA-directed RNA polymerase subunit RPC12/RpoP
LRQPVQCSRFRLHAWRVGRHRGDAVGWLAYAMVAMLLFGLGRYPSLASLRSERTQDRDGKVKAIKEEQAAVHVAPAKLPRTPRPALSDIWPPRRCVSIAKEPLAKKPERKTTCPHCGNLIFVRSRPLDRQRVL